MPKTEINLAKKTETEDVFNRQKLEFERLRSDVQIKLKFLDENRVCTNLHSSKHLDTVWTTEFVQVEIPRRKPLGGNPPLSALEILIKGGNLPHGWGVST